MIKIYIITRVGDVECMLFVKDVGNLLKPISSGIMGDPIELCDYGNVIINICRDELFDTFCDNANIDNLIKGSTIKKEVKKNYDIYNIFLKLDIDYRYVSIKLLEKIIADVNNKENNKNNNVGIIAIPITCLKKITESGKIKYLDDINGKCHHISKKFVNSTKNYFR